MTFRIIFVLCILCFLPAISSAQEEKYFSENSEVFIAQVAEKFLETKNKKHLEDSRILMQSLTERWNAGRFNKEEKDLIKAVAEYLHKNKTRIYPDVLNYFRVVNYFAYSHHLPESVVSWHISAVKLIENNSFKEFKELVDFTNALFQNGKIYDRNSMSWLVSNSKFNFEFDSVLSLNFKQTNLICATVRDSSIIRNTSGRLVYASNRWIGKGGNVSWRRFALDETKVFVELFDYSVDLIQSEYSADSVVFRNLFYYQSPIIGSFQDKVFSSPPSSRTGYPRFNSYVRNLFVQDLFKGIDFEGGLTMEGMSLYGTGTGNEPASLYFRREGKLFGRVLSQSLQISSDRLLSERALATFYLDGDSLFHPGLRLRYTNNNRQLTLYRSETGLADSPFFNSYHKVDLYIEAMYWELDKEFIAFRRLEGLGTESSGKIESANYYANIDFQRLQGIDDLNPMFVIENYLKLYGDGREIRLNALAEFMKKPAEQVVAQLLRLASLGYLVYNPENQSAVVKDKFFYALAARGGRTDYDVMRLISNTRMRTPNALLDLSKLEMTINGVPEVILSDSQRVNIFPDLGTIVLKKNRDFIFSGLIKAGQFDFYARDCFFEYDSFRLNMSFVDSLAFYVGVREADKKNFKNRYIKVRNVISNLNGTLFIDNPHNKSGLKSFPNYPVFNSRDESYVYFDMPDIQSGTLNRESFYYVVDPFEIDSLDNFTTDFLHFEGYLASAGIFPGFREPLVVMPDYSLGFEHAVPEKGYPMFVNKATYFQLIHLSNQGFFGQGAIDYLTTNSESPRYIFYPDSVTSPGLRFNMQEQLSPVEYPRGQADTIAMSWLAKEDKMILRTIKKPFLIFNNAEHIGQLEISPVGTNGSGKLEFGDAEIISDYFNYNSHSFEADTAYFTLYTSVEKKRAFMAEAYKAEINFDKRIGKFRYIDGKSHISFPFNQYMCSLDEATWLMDDDKLLLNNNRLGQVFDIPNLDHYELLDIDFTGSGFVSTHPEQDSLSFFCLEAEYDLINYAILAQNVKIIRVADAAIFPNDGLVTILQDARMQTLESATIIANTTNRFHLINDARINVFSKHKYEGKGYYDYIDMNKTVQPIELSAIWVNDKGTTVARGSIPESAIFFLNPYFYFAGLTNLSADNKHVRFTGGYRVNQDCYTGSSAWVSFDTLIDPAMVKLPVPKEPVDLSGLRLDAGLFFNANTGKYYPSLLDYRKSMENKPLSQIEGSLFYDEQAKAFVIEPKANSSSSTFVMQTDRCIFSGKGPITLDLTMPFVNYYSFGDFTHKLIADSTYINIFLTLQFAFDEKLMGQMIDSLNKANLPGVNLLQTHFLDAMRQRLSNEEVEKLRDDINLYGSPRKIPDWLINSLVFSDVRMKWNPSTRSFVSYGAIGVGNIRRNQINKYIDGYIELEKSKSGDGFSIYLQPDANSWYYFNFKNNILQAYSTSEQFNNELINMKPDKRKITNRETGEQYEFVISTRSKAVEFVRKMQSVSF